MQLEAGLVEGVCGTGAARQHRGVRVSDADTPSNDEDQQVGSATSRPAMRCCITKVERLGSRARRHGARLDAGPVSAASLAHTTAAKCNSRGASLSHIKGQRY